jgi:hypothetical protein
MGRTTIIVMTSTVNGQRRLSPVAGMATVTVCGSHSLLAQDPGFQFKLSRANAATLLSLYPSQSRHALQVPGGKPAAPVLFIHTLFYIMLYYIIFLLGSYNIHIYLYVYIGIL